MLPYRGKTKEGKWVYGYLLILLDGSHIIVEEAAKTILTHPHYPNINVGIYFEVIPETVGRNTGLDCWEHDYVVMDCWNGGDGKDEPDLHDTFEGIVIWDKQCAGFGIQTKLCKDGEVEVLLRNNEFHKIEVVGNIVDNPELK